MRKILSTLLLTVVAAAGIVGLADAGQSGLLSAGARADTDQSFEKLEFTPDPAFAQDRARSRLRLTYLTSPPQIVPANGSVAFTGTCPAGGRAIDGGFSSDGFVFADLLAPLRTNQYGYRVRDVIGVQGTVIFSLTCIR